MKLSRGYSLIELLIVLAISAILLGSTVPLGSHWIRSASLSAADGEISHGIGIAIATAFRNEQALDGKEPAATLCISDTNQLSVLEANASELPNCTAGTGTSVWSSSVPDRAAVTNDGNAISCLCFNPYGLLTSNNCPDCTTDTTLELSVDSTTRVLYVR